jgi:hypothetical protein
MRDMDDIERRSRTDRRRVSRNGRRVTDPATPAVDNDRERFTREDVSREEGLRNHARDVEASRLRLTSKSASSSVVASDK